MRREETHEMVKESASLEASTFSGVPIMNHHHHLYTFHDITRVKFEGIPPFEIFLLV